MKILDFEAPIIELTEKINNLKHLSKENRPELIDEIERIENRALRLRKEIFAKLTPVQIVQLARHPNRPDTLGLIPLLFTEFTALHGDRNFRDDPAIVGGLCRLDTQPVMVIGHQKGSDTKENLYRNFGMPHPEGYRKALRLMKLAEKFGIPIITFVDTPGAYPGKAAEERGQSQAIATNLKSMAGLSVPIITVILGEGGSGGALGIAVSNRVHMMEFSVYSVISPEGCASILFRDSKKSDLAAKSLRITAKEIVKLGLVDSWIPEPLGGAHQNWIETAQSIKQVLQTDIANLSKLSGEELIANRYKKFKNMGQYIDAEGMK